MALETGTYISDLVVTNPTGSDPLAFADDHLRLLKSTIKATFPNVTGEVTKTHTQINTAVDQAGAALPTAGGTMTGPIVLSGAPTADLQASTKAYVDTKASTAVSDAATAAAALYPTKTGTGASGTWNINISGNAATATTATTAANGGVTSVNGSTGAVTVTSVGVGQTWQAVSRVSGTDYQNTTGRPIQLAVTFGGRTGVVYVGVTTGAYVQVSGTTNSLSNDNNARPVHSLIIPNNHYYKIVGPINNVNELR